MRPPRNTPWRLRSSRGAAAKAAAFFRARVTLQTPHLGAFCVFPIPQARPHDDRPLARRVVGGRPRRISTYHDQGVRGRSPVAVPLKDTHAATPTCVGGRSAQRCGVCSLHSHLKITRAALRRVVTSSSRSFELVDAGDDRRPFRLVGQVPTSRDLAARSFGASRSVDDPALTDLSPRATGGTSWASDLTDPAGGSAVFQGDAHVEKTPDLAQIVYGIRDR
jgi:hypothetical protein